ncbi:MAG: tetratricopeptide repeat protein [Treponema sp.]|nr:tetratricopeptide repeat protein [Treponema sp.]
MAENVIREDNLAEKINTKLIAARKPLLAALIVVVVLVVGLSAFVLVSEHATKKGLAQIDEIYYSLTSQAGKVLSDAASDSAEATVEDELFASSKEAITSLGNVSLEALAAFSKKGGIVGVRANMLSAEIYFQQNQFDKARESWLSAARAKKGAYTAPLAYFNAAVCSEKLNDLESAVSYYTAASEAEDFLLVDHALFSLGRVNEAVENVAAAKAAYEKLTDTHPESSWANLAKSRLIAFKANGTAE